MSVLDLIEIYGEDESKNMLSSFRCPLNKDVEDFIHNKAILFAKQHIAMTFLVFYEQNNQLLLIGYYTLTNKFVPISESSLSKTMLKRISKFSQYDSYLKRYLISIPLIAQLGKNFAYFECISGSELLSLACERVKQAQKIIGGKMVYIECASNPKLHAFYESNDFIEFGQREKEIGELGNDSTLVQMVKYFK